MIPTDRRRGWTFADLVRLPDDGQRYELVDRALVVTPLGTAAGIARDKRSSMRRRGRSALAQM